MAQAARAAWPTRAASPLTFLVDADVAVYAQVPSRYRDACVELLEGVARGAAAGRMSTAILEEIWHIERSGKARPTEGLTHRMYLLFTPLLAVTDEIVARAMQLDAPRLGTNDRLHVATALVNGVGAIVSADRAFDTVRELRRIDPLDDVERAKLLRG